MKKIAFIIFWTLFSLHAAAQVEFIAEAPEVVEVGETFRYTLTANAKGKDVELGALTGFDLLGGPSVSSSTSLSSVNGKTTRTESNNYTYVLSAGEEGTFVINPATITIGGKKYQSNALTVKVIKGSGEPKASQGEGNRAVATEKRITAENLFLRLEVDKTEPYVGQGVIATLKVYSRVDLTNFGSAKFPDFNGFLKEDVEIPQIQLHREEYNGQIYQVGVLRRYVLFPQQSGELTIDPFELECLVRQQLSQNRGQGSLFDFDSFFGNYQEVSVPRKTEPVTLQVKPLPEGAPAGFSGTVGTLKMRTSLTVDSLAVDEAATYTVTFTGTGNLRLINPPKLSFPPDIDVFDPKINKTINTGDDGVSGTVTFEYLVIPRHAGNFTIPAVRYNFFDIKRGAYQTLIGESYQISVAPSRNGATTTPDGKVITFKKEDLQHLGEDIRFIKTSPHRLSPIDAQFYGKPLFIILMILPALIAVSLLSLNRRRIKAAADVARVRSRTANTMARRRLKEAAAAMNRGETTQFYLELLKAMWGYMSYKLNIEVASLNRDNILEILTGRGVDAGAIKAFIELLDRAEFARYAPVGYEKETMTDCYTLGEQIISKMEKLL